ncbi:MAG: methyltransferase domain-containing protein [Alphaproteobacteria bacterium]
MTSPRNAKVAKAFAARAQGYEQNASLQAEIAEKLARLLPDLERPKVLEIGCGTGFLTRHLLERYPHGDFLITDLVPEMLAVCRTRMEGADKRPCRFAMMDGEAPDCGAGFDLIALSMTLCLRPAPWADRNAATARSCRAGNPYCGLWRRRCFPQSAQGHRSDYAAYRL